MKDDSAIGVTNGALVYSLIFENKILPDSVNTHIRNNGVALKINVLE
jgi:hypothetical protein